MFYITRVSGIREPYRVEPLNKDRQSGEEQTPHHSFDQEEESQHHEKILKADEKLYKKKSVMQASQIMNRQLLILNEHLSVDEAWKKVKHHEVQYFPVINQEGKLLGMLSERDLLRELEGKKERKLKDIMANRTLCAEVNTKLSELVQVFSEKSLEAVPVIDETHQVVGILTQSDLLQTIIKVSNLHIL